MRAVLNWVNLSTPLGLLVARWGRCATRPGPHGLILAEGYRCDFPVAGAFTIGNVVVTKYHFDDLLRINPRLLAHEARHATQWAALWGLPFLPCYGLAALYSLIRGGDHAQHNIFEMAAGLGSGGYRQRDSRR